VSLLEDLTAALTEIGIPIETGVFSDEAPDEYVVITPLSDNFVFFADDSARLETQGALISLYCKGNYVGRKNEITNKVIEMNLSITERKYIGYEIESGYHHYAVGAEGLYEL
jgi:hypothetical protein